MGLPAIFIALTSLINRFSIKININYEKKEIKQILRIEHDDDRFEICQPQKERIRVLGIVPKTRLIHRTANDDWDIKSLW